MFGYLSGTILTIMCSKIILIYTSENLLFLIKKFFLTFANWFAFFNINVDRYK